MKESSKVKVRLPVSLGAKSCGPYKAGEVYEVDADEAERLIKVKQFERISKSDKEA